jgi:hypothetical protein
MTDIIRCYREQINEESGDLLLKEMREGRDAQSRTLAATRIYLRDGFLIDDLTNKELLLLSGIVRQLLSDQSKEKFTDKAIDVEASGQWILKVTGHNFSDLQELRDEEPKNYPLYIKSLREKFNRDDDQGIT